MAAGAAKKREAGCRAGRKPAPAPPLVDEPEPPPEAPRADPAPSPPPAGHAPQIQVLAELSARLLASMRELLAGYERVLIPAASPPPSARRTARHRPESPDVTLTAGPFSSLEALREFEHAVSCLPGVRDLAIRGYEGTDRAIIEVRLDQRSP